MENHLLRERSMLPVTRSLFRDLAFMTDVVRLLVDGKMIKAARKPGGLHHQALRILQPGQPERRDWGATISGELRVFRARPEDDFEIEVRGDFTSGSPEPDYGERWPLKHIYVQQSRRQKYLNALVARCNHASWYRHDIRIIGKSEIVYDRHGKGFQKNAQLSIQTRGKVVSVGEAWEPPAQREHWVDPAILGTSPGPP